MAKEWDPMTEALRSPLMQDALRAPTPRYNPGLTAIEVRFMPSMRSVLRFYELGV